MRSLVAELKKDLKDMYTKRDVSIKAMDKALFDNFGANGKDLQKMNKAGIFNIFDAYEFLKDYCGMNTIWFDDEEYKKRMVNITKLLRV